MNLPNKLTILRTIMIPVFLIFLYIPGLGMTGDVLAAAIFVLASFTDLLDGKIARKYNLVTNFGKFMDPLADKLLVYGPQSHLYVEGANAAGLSDAREYPDRPALTQAVREAVRPGDIVWFKGSLLMNLEEVLRAVFPDAE